MLNNAFYHLPNLPELDDKYVTAAFSADYILPEPEVNGIRTTRSIWCYSPFSETKFFKDLQSHVGEPFTAMYYRFDPMTVYDWHTDRDRECSINFVLSNNEKSLTLFRESTNNRNVFNIRVCDYILHCPILFNTRVPHTVINNNTSPRYILTVSSETASLDAVKDFVFNYQTDSY